MALVTRQIAAIQTATGQVTLEVVIDDVLGVIVSASATNSGDRRAHIVTTQGSVKINAGQTITRNLNIPESILDGLGIAADY